MGPPPRGVRPLRAAAPPPLVAVLRSPRLHCWAGVVVLRRLMIQQGLLELPRLAVAPDEGRSRRGCLRTHLGHMALLAASAAPFPLADGAHCVAHRPTMVLVAPIVAQKPPPGFVPALPAVASSPASSSFLARSLAGVALVPASPRTLVIVLAAASISTPLCLCLNLLPADDHPLAHGAGRFSGTRQRDLALGCLRQRLEVYPS